MTMTKPAIDLGEFDGSPVAATSIKVTNAGDGLSAAMSVDPQVMHLGQRVYVVLECDVADVSFAESKDDDGTVIRVHKLRAGDAAIIDRDLVIDSIQAQRDRIEEAKGIEKLPFEEAEVAELIVALEEALTDGKVFRDVDHEPGIALNNALVTAGWTSQDDPEGATVLTAPDGRSFSMFIVDEALDEEEIADDAEVTPIGRGRGKGRKAAN